jgi:hypothetical protein
MIKFSSRCGNIGMEVNIGQPEMRNDERRGNEDCKWSLSPLTSTKEFLLFRHPLRLGQASRSITLRDGKNSTGTNEEEEENSLLSPLSDMYCIASNFLKIRHLREGSWLNGGKYWHFLQFNNLNSTRFVSDKSQLGSLIP